MSGGTYVSGWFLRNISALNCARCSLRWCRTSLDGAVSFAPVIVTYAGSSVFPVNQGAGVLLRRSSDGCDVAS